MSLVVEPSLLDQARSDATTAAAYAGVEAVEVHDLDDLRTVSDLFSSIWGRVGDTQLVPFELLRAMSHGGNYISAAVRDGTIVGAAFGFRAAHHGEPALHSHVLGVAGGRRSRGVGFALKQHQRRWCLERGIQVMTWTFDPLVRPNAWLNLARLGADVDEYLPHFYGRMDDAMNSGDSDRLLIRWDLLSDRAVAAARRDLAVADDELLDRYEPVLTDVAGAPKVVALDAGAVRCQVPDDIVGVRAKDLDLAARWRISLREVMAPRLEDGFSVDGIHRDGWYLLSRRA